MSRNVDVAERELHFSGIRKTEGITLVALIVTIIILLILSGITIAQLTESGLFSQVQRTKTEQLKSEAKENINMAVMEIQIDEMESNKATTLESLSKKLASKDNRIEVDMYNAGDTELTGIYVSSSKTSFKYVIQNDFNVLIGDEVKTKEKMVKFGEIQWNNGRAQIEISTEKSQYIEYQVNSTTDGQWITSTNEGTSVIVNNLKFGDIVYARLTDGTNPSEYEIKNIADTIKPIGSITLEKNSVKITETINATVIMQDNESGINAANCKWVITNSNTNVGEDISSYSGGTVANDGTITTIYDSEGEFYLHVLLVDNVGNKQEIVSANKILISAFSYTSVNMVEYDAGEWTQEQINVLKQKKLYNINISKTASTYDGLNFTFGGFTYKGDSDSNNSNAVKNGTIVTNRNKSVVDGCQKQPTSDGWMVLEWGDTVGTKKYVKTIIHAGSPENFVYGTTQANDAFRAEYILSNGERCTTCNTYQARDWQEYIDKNQADLIANKTVGEKTIKDIHVVQYGEKSSSDFNFLTGSYYWLASGRSDGMSGDRLINYEWNQYYGRGSWGPCCYGIRPIITLVDGVYVDTSAHSGKGTDKYILQKD